MRRWIAVLLALSLAVPVASDVVTKSGADSTTLTIDPNQNAARVTIRPLNVGSMGSYAIAGTTGTIAAGMAANAAIFQFRWTSGSAVALLRTVKIGAASGGTGFTAGTASCGLVFARSYTVTGTTGSNSIAITGSEGKRRTSFATSSVTNGNIRISGTAASTGQTWVLDTSDMARLGPFGVGTATQTAFIPAGTVLWQPDYAGEWPLVLAQDEGFAVRCTVPATGVWSAVVSIEWTEVAAF
jgi:hypothetical protein